MGSNNAPVNYILTYKFSQDHLELFFCAIRSSGGFNNNPTAQQFTAAYKRLTLLLRIGIEGNNGNCQIQDGTDILEAFGNSCKIKEKELTVNDAAIIRKYDLQGQLDPQCKDDLSDAPTIPFLSEFKTAAISYIAGYVVQMVQNRISCYTCCEALGSKDHQPDSAFLSLKDQGNLLNPAKSVINVCLEAEKCCQRMLATYN